MVQPESVRFHEPKYDALEIITIDEHLCLIQVGEDGEAETLVIGPAQKQALLVFLQQQLGGR